MSELEDLSAKAARLWLEFMQAQARAAASAAEKLPDVTRSLAEAGLPLAAEVNRWIAGALPATRASRDARPQAGPAQDEAPASAAAKVASPADTRRCAPATRINHRRLKTPRSMSRRRARRA